MNELPTPMEGQAVELLRVWLSGQTLQCALRADAFDDAAAWGEILADVARHVAEALRSDAMTAEQTLQRIRASFDAEMRSPPTDDTGETTERVASAPELPSAQEAGATRSAVL